MDATAEVRRSFKRLSETQQYEFSNCLSARSGQPYPPPLAEMLCAVEQLPPHEREEFSVWVSRYMDVVQMLQGMEPPKFRIEVEPVDPVAWAQFLKEIGIN